MKSIDIHMIFNDKDMYIVSTQFMGGLCASVALRTCCRRCGSRAGNAHAADLWGVSMHKAFLERVEGVNMHSNL